MVAGFAPTKPWNVFSRVPKAISIASAIDSLPANWRLTPLQGKSPKRQNWQHEEPVDRELVRSLILEGESKISQKGNPYRAYWSGYGLRTGEGLLAIDVDGEGADRLLNAISGGNLPETVSWTSGKRGRRQLLYRVPDDKLQGFSRRAIREWGEIKVDCDLDFRYEGCQSAIPPSLHPDTGEYRWLRSPSEIEVAAAPEWLIEFVVGLAVADRSETEAKREARQQQFRQHATRQQQFRETGVTEDLTDFYRFEVLPRLTPEQIYNWNGHNWHYTRDGLQGCPPWRQSASGRSFHVDFVDGQWLWHCYGSGEGGDAVKYRHWLNGGTGYPRGKDWVEIVRVLASEVGLELPERKRIVEPDRQSTPEQSAILQKNAKVNGLTYKPDLVVNSRYLGSEFWKAFDRPGLLFCKSHKGSGKSRSLLKPLIAEWKRRGERVLSITVRVLLGLEQSPKFDIEWIDSAGIHHKQVCLCWDSLLKLADLEWQHIVIDEVRMGVKHLVTSTTSIDKIRPQVLRGFRLLLEETLSKGGSVVCCDADLTDVEIDYLKALAPGATTFLAVNEGRGDGVDCTFFEGKRDVAGSQIEEAVEAAVEAWRNGEVYGPIIVCADSQAEIKALHNIFSERYPEAAHLFWRFDKETSEEEENRVRINDLNGAIERERPIGLFYSPTLAIGASIDVDYFKKRFGLYFGVLEPCEFRQMLARNRTPIDTVIWAAKSNHLLYANGSDSPDSIKTQQGKNHQSSIDAIGFAERLARDESISSGDAHDYLQILQGILEGKSNPHFEVWAEVCARANFGKKNCGTLLKEELIEIEGWNLRVFDGEVNSYSDTVKAQKEADRLVLATKLAIGANDIRCDENWAKEVLNNPRSSHDDRLHAQGVMMQARTPGFNFTPEFIDEYVLKDRNWQSQQWIGWLVDRPEVATHLDFVSNCSHFRKVREGGDSFLPSIKTSMATVRMLEELGIREIINYPDELHAEHPLVKKTFDLALSQCDRVKAATGISVSEKSQKLKFVRSLVEKVGLKLESTGRSSSQRRAIVTGHDKHLRVAWRLSLDLRHEDRIDGGAKFQLGEAILLADRELHTGIQNEVSIERQNAQNPYGSRVTQGCDGNAFLYNNVAASSVDRESSQIDGQDDRQVANAAIVQDSGGKKQVSNRSWAGLIGRIPESVSRAWDSAWWARGQIVRVLSEPFYNDFFRRWQIDCELEDGQKVVTPCDSFELVREAVT